MRLSKNSSEEAITLLKENQDKINWVELSYNPSFEAVKLLLDNPSKIDWYYLSQNIHIF